ncbi:lipopolysaccharide biosynthesis protein [Lacticaseibacillus parakribbianus]|uniref:lipopolysaccharide biosynthesis protein n=1 Tax=Lacticaseibacillus parakribbianus TaxID=2970927 RepID=UPI0021CB6AF6|nr:oligosaccharide flippase family protein [Lacticaseibacillus parakribbianus]
MRSRTHLSIVNTTAATLMYFLRILLGFVSRTFFIHQLGVEYLGLNGLFTNILSFLSLAELGFGTSIAFELYSPIANKNFEAIKSLMYLYRKAYRIIGIIIGALGIIIMPILPYMMKGGIDAPYLLYYLLFLANSVISYFFTYKRSLLNADQKNYVVIINDFLVFAVTVAFQVSVLVIWQSYTGYLVLQIVGTLTANLTITAIANKQYPYLLEKNIENVDPTTVRGLFKNVIGNISSQIGTIVVTGSDNILISAFVGLTEVGIYSNYTLLTNALRSLVQQATGSLTASFGNLIAEKSGQKTMRIFHRYWFINSSVSYLTAIAVFLLVNDFVRIWVGSKYLLPKHTVFLMSLYLFLLMFQGTVRSFISAFGLFWQQRWKPVFESVTNLGLSVFFLKVLDLSIDGVLLGTICSTLLVIAWYEPYLLFKYGFKSSVRSYLVGTLGFYFAYFITIGVLWQIEGIYVPRDLLGFLIYAIISGVGILLIFISFFGRTPGFRDVCRWIRAFKFNSGNRSGR